MRSGRFWLISCGILDRGANFAHRGWETLSLACECFTVETARLVPSRDHSVAGYNRGWRPYTLEWDRNSFLQMKDWDWRPYTLEWDRNSFLQMIDWDWRPYTLEWDCKSLMQMKHCAWLALSAGVRSKVDTGVIAFVVWPTHLSVLGAIHSYP